MVFALEIFGRSGAVRYGGTLNTFAERAGLARTFRLGVLALVIDGVVLAGVGYGAPGGWAALVASAVSATAIVSLPFVLNRVLQETGENQVREARTTAIRQAVSATVHTQVIETLCHAELRRLSEEHEFDVQPFLAPDIGPDDVVISAKGEGVVQDVSTRRLAKVASTSSKLGRVSLRVRIGSYVEEGSALLVLPNGTGDDVASTAEQIVRCGARTRDALSDHLNQLHDEALDAIRRSQPAVYDGIADTYVAALMEFPTIWATYKQEYDANIASGHSVIPIGPVDQVQRAMYEELTLAAEGNREIMFTAAALPMRVAQLAIDVRASGLVTKMLALYPQIYAIGANTPGEVADLLKERSWIHLKETLRFRIRPRLENLSEAIRDRAIDDAKHVYKYFANLLRLAVDRGDLDSLKKADEAWESSLRSLTLSEPDPAEVKFLEAEAADGADVQAELASARSALATATAAKSLADYRTAARLSLLAWIWHKGDELDQADAIELFTYLAGRLGSVASASNATTATLAIERDTRHTDLLSDWILYEQGEGAHAVPFEGHLFSAFVTVSLMRIKSDVPIPPLEATSWMTQFEDQLKREIDTVIKDHRLEELGVKDAPERAALLKDALAAGASAWRDAEAADVRAAKLHQPYVDEFEAFALEALADARFIPNLLEYGGATVHEETSPPVPEDLTLETFLPKKLFIENERMLGRDWVARDFGHGIAFRETRRFLDLLAEGSEAITFDDTFDTAVRSAIVTMAKDGYSPSIALFPVNFRLLRELNLPYRADAIPLPSGLALGESARSGFRGFLEEVAVFQLPDVPDDRLCLIDVRTVSMGQVWRVARPDRMHVAAIDEKSAQEIIARQAPAETDDSESSRIQNLMDHVRVTACLDTTFDIDDKDAARWVEIPANLRRE